MPVWKVVLFWPRAPRVACFLWGSFTLGPAVLPPTFIPPYKNTFVYSSKFDDFVARPKDDLPEMEAIRRCLCPRVYIPVCGTDNESYTNVCKMNCLNERLGRFHTPDYVRVQYVGVCDDYFGKLDAASIWP